MLDSEFKRLSAQVLRELVEQTNDPFTSGGFSL